MDEQPATPDARRHLGSCPPWCADCRDSDPPGTLLHRGPTTSVAVYDEACHLVDAHVRPAFWNKPPAWLGTDPADIERPHVEVHLGDGTDVQLYLNPAQARTFAAALMRSADAAETEALYRTPAPCGPPSDTAPVSAPPRSA
ncbi:DUF6907 domain-containing protein [Couchioplanes caeruleus]|uniref:Uncharacterized protein n=1 Tax=Couchioplanes caeruleus TaxID=56438 RepID=A0A3N1GCZ4_9ACTN|nr:hypothetical protein [Couchioplanes caeruleus]ROP28115.1 hypothetical protein EDD30_0824 [Couchioplanes caeruleus]